MWHFPAQDDDKICVWSRLEQVLWICGTDQNKTENESEKLLSFTNCKQGNIKRSKTDSMIKYMCYV